MVEEEVGEAETEFGVCGEERGEGCLEGLEAGGGEEGVEEGRGVGELV